MTYQALYRVWRPRVFQDLVGQSHITKTIQHAIEQRKFSHAYLFSGPRGTGKTSAAKIFAKTINCEKAPVKEPCNECAACIGVQEGSIPDVIEIDAASNTSVEDVRDIRDNVKYAANTVSYKVYIIDEVHMISTNAFNALLKTLEEPPEHVVFILATTEPHKIPLTVISRCQFFDFKPLTNRTMVERMRHIMQQEDIDVTDEALETVALAAEGGMRDALSILDQAISYSDDDVSVEDVLAVTSGVSQQELTGILHHIHQRDAHEALEQLDRMIQSGKDPGRFVFDLLYFLRDVLLYKNAPSLEDMLARAIVDEDFKQLAGTVTDEWIQHAITQLNTCQQDMKWTNSPKIFIEIAILSMTNGEGKTSGDKSDADDSTVTDLLQKVERLEQELESMKQSRSAPETNAPAPPREPDRRKSYAPKNSYKVPYDKIRQVLDEAKKDALQDVNRQWSQFLSALKKTSAPAHATIQDSNPAAASDHALVVAFKYAIHCSLFLENRETVESVLNRTLNKQLEIIPIPVNNWQELREEYIQKQHEPAAEEPPESDPMVEKAQQLFGDDVVRIHDQ